MNDDELKKLKDFPTPAPRSGARAKTFAAAMAAFDQAASGDEGESVEKDAQAPQKNAKAPQGSARPIRLIHASSEQKRRRPMRAWPVSYRVAASVAAMLLAAPVAFYVIQRQGGESEPPSYRVTEREQSAPAADAKATAPATSPGGKRFPNGGKAIFDRLSADDASAPRGDSSIDDRIDQALRQAKKGDPETSASASTPTGEAPRPVSTFRVYPDGRTEAPAEAEAQVPAPAPASKPAQVALAAPEKEKSRAVESQPRSRIIAGEPGAGASPVAAAPASPPPPSHSLSRDVSAKEIPTAIELPSSQMESRDKFEAPAIGPLKQTAVEPVSTFSIDVDTASYGFARRALNAGHLPPKDSVRVEEMINYFPYDYPRPDGADRPFQPTVTVTPAPWNPTNKLVHIAIKGYDVKGEQRPRANVVLLIDVSGSMSPENRLPLVKNAFRLLVDELKPDDTVGIVTYASGSGVALEPTKVSEKSKILNAIEGLGAGGSTAGAQGIQDAYRLAEAHFDKTGVNRIILATDGDFNVGVTSTDELKHYIEQKRQTGIFLSILGVGQNNYNDALMQTLAQNGNGVASYVDTLNEARKVLVDESSSTLFTIAKDVKIQMEFNPAQISEYRLIGYETRALKREDFNNDKVDAGEIGSGHAVTAIYEVTPVGAPKFVDDLRYQKPEAKTGGAGAGAAPDANELGFLKLRYKLPKEDVSKLITIPVTRDMEKSSIAEAPEDVRFSIAVAGFGQLLRDQPYLKSFGYDEVIALGRGARGADPFGYRAEFLNLVRLAKLARR
jgi:Ca-activated chloride channel homolog